MSEMSSQPLPPQPSQPVIIYAPPDQDNIKEYASRTVRIFGLVKILGGVFCIIAQIVAICVGSTSLLVSAGIWVGVFYCLAGTIGIFSGKYRTSCWIIAYMVFCIIASVFTCAIIIGSSIALGTDHGQIDEYYDFSHPGELDTAKFNKAYHTAMTFNALMIITAVVELVLLIWGSVLACKVMCCAGQPLQGVVMLPVQYTDGQAIMLPSGQQAPGQPASASHPPAYCSEATAPLVPTEEEKGEPKMPPPANTEKMPNLDNLQR